MRAIKIPVIVGLALLPALATASAVMMKQHKTLVPPPAGSAMAKANCKACHTTGKNLNPYGSDISKAMKALKAKAITAPVLKKVEALDSDKDGVANGAETKAGTLPGDAASK
jgi:mono/diheme cytochrome c family protein